MRARGCMGSFMFGTPGSSACEVAAKFYGVKPQVGQRCYLSGPDDNRADLASGLPPGVTAAEGETLAVPPGTVVLQAADVTSSHQTKFASPDAQFYVLKDNVSLTGNEITNPRQSTDPSGAPDVTFGFTSKGDSAFQHVTAAIARRGELDSIGQTSLIQHFAVALDNKLITVPQIDYHQYPHGVIGDSGAAIAAGFTISSARHFATELRLGALPINLKLIEKSRYPVARLTALKRHRARQIRQASRSIPRVPLGQPAFAARRGGGNRTGSTGAARD